MEARRLEETDEEALKVFRRGWLAEPKLGTKAGESAFQLHPNAPIGGPDFWRQAGGKT